MISVDILLFYVLPAGAALLVIFVLLVFLARNRIHWWWQRSERNDVRADVTIQVGEMQEVTQVRMKDLEDALKKLEEDRKKLNVSLEEIKVGVEESSVDREEAEDEDDAELEVAASEEDEEAEEADKSEANIIGADEIGEDALENALGARRSGPTRDSPLAYTVFFGTNRRMTRPGDPSSGFSSDRDRTTHYGTCEVAIPESHKFGSLGSSWLRRMATRTDDRLKLVGIGPHTARSFWKMIKVELDTYDPLERQALVYIHGYSCSFEAAALRAAQIGADLKTQGVMAFFSWPSKGKTEAYAADEATIGASESAIKDFLLRLVKDVGADRVHVIAHSMGNRGLLRVMARIAAGLERADSSVRFGQIFLAAPDVDADVFRDLATVYPQLSQRTTLYVSPGDKAVGLSKWLHDFPRAGFTPPITCVPDIDTVEIPDFDLDVLGHTYFAKAAGVLHDMFMLLRHDDPPEDRQRLSERVDDDGATYWTMLS